MKSFVMLVIFLISQTLLANSSEYGPYVNFTLKGPKTAAANCHISPSQITITKSSGEKTLKSVDLDAMELSRAIMAASRGLLKTTGLHIVAQVPAVEISAGLYPTLSSFLIYQDSSAIKTRSGVDSSDLIKLARTHCGKLTIK